MRESSKVEVGARAKERVIIKSEVSTLLIEGNEDKPQGSTASAKPSKRDDGLHRNRSVPSH